MNTQTTIRLALMLSFLFVTASCSRSDLMKTAFVGGAEGYFAQDAVADLRLTHLEGPLYTFEHSWNRGVAAKTEKGWVVVDVYGARTAEALKAALEKEAPGLPVHLLIYSHYHLDHVEGGAALEPERVLAHEKCAAYWEPFGGVPVVAPTESATGDTMIDVGGLAIELLDMGRSHTDTLFAVHFPAQRAVFGADLAMVDAFPPNGMPDHYRPGFIKALDRLAALDFDIYISSHFAMGTREDVIANRDFYKRAQALAMQARQDYGFPVAGEELDPAVTAVYAPLKEEYGDWHGADTFLVPFVMRTLVGVWLGY